VFKKAIFVVLDALLFLLVYAVGAVLPGIGKLPMWTITYSAGRSLFIWDGLVLMLIPFVLILIVQAIRKVLRTHWAVPVLALVLSLLLLAATRFPLSRLTPSS
jgi:hypothetical protein